jgi:hypothetical protein
MTAWLDGEPMRPGAEPVEPLPTIAGVPFLHPGSGCVIVGPTGSGRSNAAGVACYDASAYGIRSAYLGSEITEGEFNARGSIIAERRGDTIDSELLERLSLVRYINLATAFSAAVIDPQAWVEGMMSRYDIAWIDPLSTVASTLGYDFDRSNSEFVTFYDRFVQPLTTAGMTVVLLENVGHALEAKGRAKGASAKSDRADLTFSCAKAPQGLLIKAQKVRSMRAAFRSGDQWLFDRETFEFRRQHTDGTAGDGDDATFRPTLLMQRVSEFVAANPGVGKKAIRDGVSGRNSYVDEAIRLLIDEGFVEQRPDERGGHHHYPIRPFNDDSDDGPCPDRAQTGVPTVPTLPHSVPNLAPVPAEDRAPRAIQTKSVGHGAQSGHAPACNCHDGPADLIDGRCGRCFGVIA